MHPHKQHPLLEEPNLIAIHDTNLLYRPPKELLPRSLAPEKFTWCNGASFVKQSSDYLGIDVEGQRFVAVAAGN